MPKATVAHGFTLIEILVVIAIIGVLGTIGFIYYRTFQATQVLNSATLQVQSLLRQAQANATASVKCSGAGAREWLIIFTSNTTLELKCVNPTSGSNLVKSLMLPQNVRFDTITGAPNCTWNLPATISFSVLYGKVNFKEASPTCTSFVVPLKITLGDINYTKTIIVTKGGGIDVTN